MINVNYVAIIVAAVFSMAIGFAWYSFLFRKQWTKLKGYSESNLQKEQKEMGKLYGLSFVGALITAYVLSHVMSLSQNFYGYPETQTALTSAFFMWLGFVMPVQLTNTIFGDKKFQLLTIDTGYQLVSLIAMGVVIALM